MNIAQAKSIPLEQLVIRLGGRFSHKGAGKDTWYFSPFRPDEKTASFKVDTATNKWHDFARTNKVDAHGDILDLWTDYNNLTRRDGAALKQALQALDNDFMSAPARRSSTNRAPSITPVAVSAESRYRITKSPGKIWMDSLHAEIARRKLSLAIVQPYLKQACIEDTKTKRKYYGFALQNDKGGYEVSIPNPKTNKSFKTAIGPKAILSFPSPTQQNACVFEGIWDCLTYLVLMKNFKDVPNLYVLNSTSMAYELAQVLITNKERIDTVLLFLDNDVAGLKAQTQVLDLLEPHGVTAGTMNHLYQNHKDLSDYWMNDTLAAPLALKPDRKVFNDTAWDRAKSSLNQSRL